MRHLRRFGSYGGAVAALTCALFISAAIPAWAAGSALEGRWQLADQYYGEGSSDLATRGQKVTLEIRGGVTGVSVRTWPEGFEREATDWPTLPGIDGEPTVEIDHKDVSLEDGRLVARYKVRPVDDEGWTLSIEENYSLDEETDTLIGTMTVRMLRDGEVDGSYTLRRVFRRLR